jgi:carboxymethylenebutenolidase
MSVARAEDLRFPAAGGFEMLAHLARPDAGDRPWPGVIVIHEVFGLNDDIRRIAGRFAGAGYVALAPNLLDRAPKPICILRAMRDLRRGTGGAFDDLEAARAWLAARDDVDASRVGVAGFCMGGGFALLFAVTAPVGATAPFYGDVPKRADDLRGVAPVCASFGARDRIFGPKARRLERHLAELGVPHDVKVYAEAGHSFMSDHEPGGILKVLGPLIPMHAGFHGPSAEDAWQRVLRFFGEHLGR